MTLESRKKWSIENSVTPNNYLELLNIRDVKDTEKFLNPSLKEIPSFKKLFNSQKAAKEIVKAIQEGKKLYIHGDFDSDGVCATAILWECIYYEISKELGVEPNVYPYIPSRVDEGYGLSEQSLDKMIADGAQLIITVDCGIRDRDRIEKYIKEKDISIIVTDHHEPPVEIESAKFTVVHPMFPNHEYPYAKISGSAVSFLLTLALRDEVGLDSNIEKNSVGLDLVGISTVTDLMPLIDINRIFVKYSLDQVKENPRPGLKALLELASVPLDTLDSYHYGFVVGPRLNAAGRVGHAMDALRLLVSRNSQQTREYSSKLHNLNLKRQESTYELLNQVEAILPDFENEKLIFIHGTNWHEGIIGLVAGKIFEKTGKPTIIATTTEKEIKASARSIKEFNITEVLEKHSEYLIKYGGHAQAAGFTVIPEQIDNLKMSLLSYAQEHITDDMLLNYVKVDIVSDLNTLDLDFHEKIETFKPFGFGNPKPLILIENLEIYEKKSISEGKHLKLVCGNNGLRINLVLFNCDADVEKLNEGDIIDVVGHTTVNSWNNKKNLEFQVKQWRKR